MNTTARWAALLVAAFLFCTSADAMTIKTVPVGNPGNPADTRYEVTGVGSVDYHYRIGTTEVTNAQYVAFLNAVDPSGANTLALYSSLMASAATGGINVNGDAANGSKYEVKPLREDNPVVLVSWYSAIRFANWLHNGQGSGDTETGAYTLGALDDEGTPMNGNSITRNPGARWWLPNEDEWYKAAYHVNDGVTGNYWDYPTSTDTEPYSDQPPGSAALDPSNTANFYKDDDTANGYDDGFAVTGSTSFVDSLNYLTDVGAYTSALSPYGTVDQGGNVWEWNETLILSAFRGLRGGSWLSSSDFLHASGGVDTLPTDYSDNYGFRVASIVPEPTGITMCAGGVLVLILGRRRK